MNRETSNFLQCLAMCLTVCVLFATLVGALYYGQKNDPGDVYWYCLQNKEVTDKTHCKDVYEMALDKAKEQQ